METTESENNVQGNCNDNSAQEAEVRNEIYQVCPARLSHSSVADKHNDVSPLRRGSSGLFSAQNIGLEDIREEDFEDECVHSTHNPPPCTTFTVLPTHTTPPSRQNKVRNPFDAALIRRLHLPILSPSVFKKVVSPTQDTHQFSWTIEDVAKIQPAPIEEYQHQQDEQAVDSETELKAQEAIDHYFCNVHIVSSPWGPQVPNNTSTLFVETSDSYSSDKETSLGNTNDEQEALFRDLSCVSTNKEVSTQTALTLPLELPPDLEAALKPYFASVELSLHDVLQDPCESIDEANLSTSTLRRKLFMHEENHQQMSLSPATSSSFSMEVECKLGSPAHSGLLLTTTSGIALPSAPVIEGRTYGTPFPRSKLISSPEISPIGSIHQRNKSVARLNFSSRMMLMENSATFSPSVSPLDMVPIQQEDDHCTDEKTAQCVLSNSSSAMITSETSSPVKEEAESFNSTSVMITSETCTPFKEKCPPFSEDVSMESLHFKQIHKKLREFENTDNFIKDGDLTNLTSFSLHSAAENSLSNVSNMHSHDTGYQTGSLSCNMTSINGGSTSAFSSLSSVSKNWTSMHFKSKEDKHISVSNEGLRSDKYNLANKGTTVALEDNSLWLPGSKHIISSTPTKTCD